MVKKISFLRNTKDNMENKKENKKIKKLLKFREL